MTKELIALIDQKEMGRIRQDARGKLSFVYAEEWQRSLESFPLSISMPLGLAEHPHARIDAFLWGLLPDNERILDQWGRRFHVSARNAFGLISHVGEDCAGAVQFVVPERVEKRQLAEQVVIVNSLRSSQTPSSRAPQQAAQTNGEAEKRRDEELLAAQAKLAELQKTVEQASAQRDDNARQAAALEAKVRELTQLVNEREQALNQTESEVAKGQELLAHDRDIRDLMGARDLYMADVHDVSGKGTAKTYGRVFYTKGKRLIFYAFDLDAQPGVQNASSFQAWGRKGPDKQEARSLGIFYEDNVSKKRWVLKADDPKSLEDIDAVFVTVEPNGGSQHPSGKQLLFAYLRISPNHP